MSNNPALLKFISIEHSAGAPVSSTNSVQVTRPPRKSTGRLRPMDYYSSCSPPDPPNPASGPYTRDVSNCGFASAMGFVNVPCGYSSFASGDAGHLYFEVYGERGSLTEGGLEYYNDTDVAPYLRSTFNPTNNGYVTLNDNAVRYGCDQNLVITHGVLSDGSGTFTEIGQLPGGEDPQSVWINDNTFTPENAAWLFYQPGSTDFTPSGADPAGNPSPCMACSVSKVTSIAQNNTSTYIDDGSYFGTDGARNYIDWMQVSFGNWNSDCYKGTSTCLMNLDPDPTPMYGGSQYYPDDGVSQSNVNSSGVAYWQTYDGIALPGGGFGTGARVASDPFSAPLPNHTSSPYAQVSIYPSASETYACTFDALEQRGRCGAGTASDWTYTTPSNTQVSSSHPIAIGLSQLSSSGCSTALVYTVSLVNPSGATVYTSPAEVSSTFSTSYSATAATGSWKWKVHAQSEPTSCSGSVYAAGSYTNTVDGAGSASYYY